LSYHAGGIKVEEEASWVGLGWSLNAGGMIMRTVKGKDDMGASGYLTSPKIMDIECGVPSSTPADLCRAPGIVNGFCSGDPQYYSIRHLGGSCQVKVGGQIKDYSYVSDLTTDWQPDIYTFNIAGKSGKFVFDQDYFSNNKIHLLEHQNIIIKTIGQPPFNSGHSVKWEITDEQGTKYLFEGKETTSGVPSAGDNLVSGWVLNKIISPNGTEITFTYTADVVTQPYWFSEAFINDRLHTAPRSAPSFVQMQYLSRIDFAEGYITFDRDLLKRQDLQDARRLRAIKVFRKDNSLIKEFILQHGYFAALGSSKVYPIFWTNLAGN
jgi:hypothetical protein